jgi:hypothetical protein
MESKNRMPPALFDLQNIANFESMRENRPINRDSKMLVARSPTQEFHDSIVFPNRTFVQVARASGLAARNEEKSIRSAPFPE